MVKVASHVTDQLPETKPTKLRITQMVVIDENGKIKQESFDTRLEELQVAPVST